MNTGKAKTMKTFIIQFPERVVGEVSSTCSCGLANCGGASVRRGLEVKISATSKHDAWDKMHRQFPFEKIVVLD